MNQLNGKALFHRYYYFFDRVPGYQHDKKLSVLVLKMKLAWKHRVLNTELSPLEFYYMHQLLRQSCSQHLILSHK